jgi:hypothetical protein
MAAGYGRQQLARLVAWLFPEKGWAISEPDQPAAQPSAQERLSMPMITPAAVALQRVAEASSVPPPPNVPRQAIPMPSAPGSRNRRIALVVLSALLVVIGTIAAVAIVVAIYFAHRSNTLPPTVVVPAAPPVPRPPMMPSVPPPQDLQVAISSSVEGAHLFMGARDLGPLPMTLYQHDLSGESLIAVAASHEPRVLRTDLVIELMRTHPSYVIGLDETDAPDQVVYVRFAGQGTAHLMDGDVLGPVPGVIVVPVHEDESPETAIVVRDEAGDELTPLGLEGCVPDRVCLLTAIPAP